MDTADVPLLPTLDELGVRFGPELVEQFRLLAGLFLTAPYRAVGPREPERVLDEIIIDSLGPFLFNIMPSADGTALDLGCGPGIPSLPLAILAPNWKFAGIDSTRKKISTAQNIAARLDLKNTDYFCERIHEDDSPRESVENRNQRKYRGQCRIVFLRGVGELFSSLRLSRRFLRPDGRAVIFSTRDAFHEAIASSPEENPDWTFVEHLYRRPSSDRIYLLAEGTRN